MLQYERCLLQDYMFDSAMMNYISCEGAEMSQKSVLLHSMAVCPLTVNWGTSASREGPCDCPLRAVAQVGLRRTLCDIEPESHEGARALNMS